MSEKIRRAVVWEAGKADFTGDVRQRMIQAATRPNHAPRIMPYNRKRLVALFAAIVCLLALAGFTAASIFGKLFDTIPYHDVVVGFKATAEYAALVEPLEPGDVATKIIDGQGTPVLYKYFKGDSFDLECYGDHEPYGGFMVIPNFAYDVPEIMQSITTTNRTPAFYRQQGMFSFALEDPAYSLVQVTEDGQRLHSLLYELDDGRHITVRTIYGRYRDTGDGTQYRPEEVTINGRAFMYLEVEDGQGISQELYCFLGDDKLAPAIELSGVPKEELLAAAGHLVLYNEEANVPGAHPRLPEDIYSGNVDPVLREHDGQVLSAVAKALEDNLDAVAWSAKGREVYADPSEYASHDIQITYTPQAWMEIDAGYRIPEPALEPFGWSGKRPLDSVTVSYRRDRLEAITIRYGDGSGYDTLSAYPLDIYLPETQLDATLITFLPAAGQIPDDLVQVSGTYYLKQSLDAGTLIYTAVLTETAAWGYRYDMADDVQEG